jgi:hypothetical protein
MSARRQMSRVGDLLGGVAEELGIDDQLRLARQMAAWQRLVEELVPAASDASRLLSIQPPALVVSASSPIVAQELRLRQADLLAAFGRSRDGVHLLELRIVIRPPTDGSSPTGGSSPTRR